jgi:acyl carrier protein
MQGKERAAFRAGFLGIDSFGFSTLVTIVEVNEAERDEAIEKLAARLVEKLGAPSLDAARAAAREEIEFSIALCHDPVGSLLALHRTIEDGDIREQFRVLKDAIKNEGADRLHSHARAFTIVESDEDEVDERVDLLGLGGLKS